MQIVKIAFPVKRIYEETALQYQISYQQFHSWTLRFGQMGEAGLENRRSRWKEGQALRTELGKAQRN